jgi:hypothetical protein
MENLHKPLKPKSFVSRLWERRPTPAQAAWALVLVLLAAGAVWAWRAPLPSSPVAEAEIRDVKPKGDSSLQTASVDEPAEPVETIRPDGAKVITFPDAGDDLAIDAADLPSSPQEAPLLGVREKKTQKLASAVIPRAAGSLPRAPIRDVTERSKFGPLPRVKGKRRPWRVYARPVPDRVLHSAKPKIALVIGGLGLNEKRTYRAIRQLPADVTLSFAPLSRNLQAQINRARAAGHEVLIEIPMEPWGWPAVNPGPQTLLVADRPETNRTRLLRLMGKAAGYIGIVNYTGQKFLTTGEALSPILHELKRRGLVFLDDGITRESLATSLAEVIGVPALRADLRIDATRDPAAIRAALDALVARAREKGAAIGIGAAFDETLKTIDKWLMEQRIGEDVLLVPLSALYRLKEAR